ncbi:MAG: M20/M25/M40 family metallo-hydrolase [Candidatus Obscuribacterales bacterium]|nr:M20/M25/M40 family metallo-hydrolase [Candidatus Obscuribacterales bacterium]
MLRVRKRWWSPVVIALSLALSVGTLSVSAATPDYQSAGDEATKILSEYLKIDTTVPPGNEQKGAEYLASVLKKDGIESQILETAPGRACVYARLKGNGKKKAIVLLNHIDVVPANAADWKHPPFCGEIHDGELWGRGALDMKGMGIIQLEAMLLLKRSGISLDRDIIFLGTPDEEVGGIYGAGWMKKNHPELLKDAEFLINEGFSIEADDSGKAKYWGVNFAEKGALWLELTAKGQAGHASMPLTDSATNRLVRALYKIEKAGPNFKVLPPVEEYFKNVSKVENGELQSTYANIAESVKDPSKLKLIMSDVLKSSMLRNTMSLTVMKAGYKTNVIPGEATAQLDCRILPGYTKDEVIDWVKKTIEEPNIDIKVLEWEQAQPSNIDTELYKSIKEVAAEEAPGIPVVPVLVPWFTDSHWFRELGITAYGFEPVETDRVHMATMHGVDERIPVKGLQDGVRRMHKILEKSAGSK